MKQHSKNAAYIADRFTEDGVKVIYPGLKDNDSYELLTKQMNIEYGYGGMIAIDMLTKDKAYEFMEKMQAKGIGYLALSLGYFKTLFSNSGSSTSSEVPEDVQKKMGMSPGLVRFSVGLDNDIERTYQLIKECL